MAPAMNDDQIEDFCEKFLKKIDDVTGPGDMSVEEAMETWDNIKIHIHSQLQMRIDAGQADLDNADELVEDEDDT